MGKPEYTGIGLFTALLGLVVVAGPGTGDGHLAGPGALAHPLVERDLAQIKHDTLRVLVLPDPLSWEQRPGAMTGLEWELLERYAQKRRIPIKAIPVSDRDSMLAMLQTGRGDVIAAQLSPEGWAAPYVHFTHFYRRVAYVEAHATSQGGTDRAESGDTLYISAWSPFLQAHGEPAPPSAMRPFKVVDRTPEDLLTATALGQVARSASSDATAAMEAKRLPLVTFGPRQGRSVPLAFAVRTNSLRLQHSLDTWLASSREGEVRSALIMAYDNGLETRGPSRYQRVLAAGADSISSYDSLFQAHADSMAWDWKLLAAVAFKESRFDTAAVSRMGAGGLMQLMPATASLMGLTDSSGVDGHVLAATRYLDRLDRIWKRDITSPAQRLKFVLASYNAGPGHVKDAQRLAVELGMDPDRWDGNVERAIVLLNRPRYFTGLAARNGYCRGQDTYWYVKDVTGLYSWLKGTGGY